MRKESINVRIGEEGGIGSLNLRIGEGRERRNGENKHKNRKGREEEE